MIGVVKHIGKDKDFGFIVVGGNTQDHFFHHSGCDGKFIEIKYRFNQGIPVEVEFDSVVNGNKGMRAENVRIVE